jgi:hypothetical protein
MLLTGDAIVGGCDPPHPASIAAAQLNSARRTKSKLFMFVALTLKTGLVA